MFFASHFVNTAPSKIEKLTILGMVSFRIGSAGKVRLQSCFLFDLVLFR
jgi:hypothetical protein